MAMTTAVSTSETSANFYEITQRNGQKTFILVAM
jgi:hypothetical protein